ncbi:MAG: RNA-binding cell elongation regulator Jag/EloR [Sphaerochaetaceae bacterium]|nr:protein jag [Candidatus Cloacimonadota bacterium]
MIKEFEGKTEQEAITLALEELDLDQDQLDIEIVDRGKRGLFKKGNVRIRVHIDNNQKQEPDEFEQKVVDYTVTLFEKMGYPATVKVAYRREDKLSLDIISEHSGIIIGKKGKNLDAIQLIVNVFAGQLDSSVKIVLDSENYRLRHEESLVRLAYRTASQVKKSGRSKLLEPMNPFERRLIHTALNEFEGVTTKSEGEGLLKQVRILVDPNLPPLREQKEV